MEKMSELNSDLDQKKEEKSKRDKGENIYRKMGFSERISRRIISSSFRTRS